MIAAFFLLQPDPAEIRGQLEATISRAKLALERLERAESEAKRELEQALDAIDASSLSPEEKAAKKAELRKSLPQAVLRKYLGPIMGSAPESLRPETVQAWESLSSQAEKVLRQAEGVYKASENGKNEFLRSCGWLVLQAASALAESARQASQGRLAIMPDGRPARLAGVDLGNRLADETARVRQDAARDLLLVEDAIELAGRKQVREAAAELARLVALHREAALSLRRTQMLLEAHLSEQEELDRLLEGAVSALRTGDAAAPAKLDAIRNRMRSRWQLIGHLRAVLDLQEQALRALQKSQ